MKPVKPIIQFTLNWF